MGLKGCVAKRRPMISKKNQAKRVKWALEHKDWTDEDWSQVLWLDESSFSFVSGTRRQVCWRKKGEEFTKGNVVGTFKHGGGSVMIWGCMSSKGVGIIRKMEGKVKAVDYIETVSSSILPSGLSLIGPNFIFQQDGCRIHTAESTMKLMETQGIRVMEWPHNLQTWIPSNICGILSSPCLLTKDPRTVMKCGQPFNPTGTPYLQRNVGNALATWRRDVRQLLRLKHFLPAFNCFCAHTSILIAIYFLLSILFYLQIWVILVFGKA